SECGGAGKTHGASVIALSSRDAHHEPVMLNGCHTRRTDAAAETGSHVLSVSDVRDTVAAGKARVRRAHQPGDASTERRDRRRGRRPGVEELRPSGWSDGHAS